MENQEEEEEFGYKQDFGNYSCPKSIQDIDKMDDIYNIFSLFFQKSQISPDHMIEVSSDFYKSLGTIFLPLEIDLYPETVKVLQKTIFRFSHQAHIPNSYQIIGIKMLNYLNITELFDSYVLEFIKSLVQQPQNSIEKGFSLTYLVQYILFGFLTIPCYNIDLISILFDIILIFVESFIQNEFSLIIKNTLYKFIYKEINKVIHEFIRHCINREDLQKKFPQFYDSCMSFLGQISIYNNSDVLNQENFLSSEVMTFLFPYFFNFNQYFELTTQTIKTLDIIMRNNFQFFENYFSPDQILNFYFGYIFKYREVLTIECKKHIWSVILKRFSPNCKIWTHMKDMIYERYNIIFQYFTGQFTLDLSNLFIEFLIDESNKIKEIMNSYHEKIISNQGQNIWLDQALKNIKEDDDEKDEVKQKILDLMKTIFE